MTDEERKEAKHRIRSRLSKYVHIEKERLQILDKMAELEARRTAPGTSKWDAMPRGGGGGAGDALIAGIARMDDLRAMYIRKVEELEKAQLAIEVLIGGLDSTERKLMRHRYIDGLPWEKVCVEMSYSWRQTHNIHAAALDKLADMLYASEKALHEIIQHQTGEITQYSGYVEFKGDISGA